MINLGELEESVSEDEFIQASSSDLGGDDIILKGVRRTTYALICIAMGVATYRLMDYFSN